MYTYLKIECSENDTEYLTKIFSKWEPSVHPGSTRGLNIIHIGVALQKQEANWVQDSLRVGNIQATLFMELTEFPRPEGYVCSDGVEVRHICCCGNENCTGMQIVVKEREKENKSFKDKLNEKMALYEISNKELADALDTPYSTVDRWRKGVSSPHKYMQPLVFNWLDDKSMSKRGEG